MPHSERRRPIVRRISSPNIVAERQQPDVIVMDARHPKVFIRHSHDSDDHRKLALRLSQRLRTDVIETNLDRYIDAKGRADPSECLAAECDQESIELPRRRTEAQRNLPK